MKWKLILIFLSKHILWHAVNGAVDIFEVNKTNPAEISSVEYIFVI